MHQGLGLKHQTILAIPKRTRQVNGGGDVTHTAGIQSEQQAAYDRSAIVFSAKYMRPPLARLAMLIVMETILPGDNFVTPEP